MGQPVANRTLAMKDFGITAPSARSNPVSLEGCRASSRPVSPLSLHPTDLIRSESPVGTRCARPSRPDASVPVRRMGAVRTESGQKPRPEATFRPKPAIRQPGTPLSDLSAPIHHAGAPLPAPQPPSGLPEPSHQTRFRHSRQHNPHNPSHLATKERKEHKTPTEH